MQDFSSKFRNLKYVLRNGKKFLLFAHTHPDPDAVGSNVGFREYIRSIGKDAEVACFDSIPAYANDLFPGVTFRHPDEIDFSKYDAVIASDSVDRGFHLIRGRIPEETVVVLIDHHPDIAVTGDIQIIDTEFSSSSEIVYLFLEYLSASITQAVATPLLLGILEDTGNLQHSCTTPQTFAAAGALIKHGANLRKITTGVLSNRKLTTLQLWGKALARAKINPKNGMIYSAITEHDITSLGNPSTEDLRIASTFLNSVPDAKFSLLLYQLKPDTVRGSFRSEPHKNIDVSAIARALGGGGHRLAGGFEMKGRIVETADGWAIV